jgi:hypothetical protein
MAIPHQSQLLRNDHSPPRSSVRRRIVVELHLVLPFRRGALMSIEKV